MKHVAILGIFLVGLVASCGNAKETIKDVEMSEFALNDTTTVVLGEMVICSDDLKLFIQFDEVIADTRCPKGANCIWEGDAAVKLSVTHKKSMDTLTLHTNQEGEKIKSLFGYSFELVNLSPYPGEEGYDTGVKAVDFIVREND